jgi:glycyl-tRNA synthetase alpha subunit
MAKHALTANRRGFLSSAVAVGAAVAVPIVAAGSAAGATCLGKAAWDAALAHYVRADNAMNRFHNDVLDPAFDRLMAAEHTKNLLGTDAAKAAHKVEFAAYDPLEKRFDDLVMERHEAVAALVKAPAPDRVALKCKMDILAADQRWECDDMGELFMAIYADTNRLLGDA